ncbi:MAG TPA: hypothetical protein PK867_01915 [Pirellulales bacterium]|nr:hypothetical protein [Pirellulales bacterium]
MLNMPANFEVTVDATLKGDGTLDLHEKPNLAPGPVTVVLVPASSKAVTHGGIADTIRHIKSRQQQRGYHGLDDNDFKQLEEEQRADEDAYEQRWHDVLNPDERTQG